MDKLPTIYHGTPITPRNALEGVCAGRAMCVSFFRPDDAEVVEAISPAVMFRQRRVFALEKSHAGWARVARKMGLARILRLVGIAVIPSRSVGGNSRYAGSAVATQRRTYQRLAFWAKRCAALAHGRPVRSAAAIVRQVRQGLSRLDRQGQGNRLPCISGADGGSRSGIRKPLAGNSHDARRCGGVRLSIWQRGQHQPCTERLAL